ncbi:MAG: hypothetical protein RBR54_09375 [Sulfurimonas sp.]|jgi:hypothetical protein|nr:hypothetical protein [Sulfurimonas sp.]
MRNIVLSGIAMVTLAGFVISCGEDDSQENVQETQEKVAEYQSNNGIYNNRGIVANEIDFKTTTPRQNKAAYVSSQCYTKTEDENGGIHNPCFSCHIDSKEPNYINDWALQTNYDFSEYTKVNRFTNLFKDRTALVGQISDEEIKEYVRENNYMQEGQILLTNRLENLPTEWDVDGDGKWSGYIPDCYFNFDNEGFDKDPQGEYTLWRAFAYYPFLGTFWPTNGSTDDVLIRLAPEFSQDTNGDFSLEVYKINLAIVESLIKEKDIFIDEIDETKYGVDLNQNGILDQAQKIVYKWEKPLYDSASNLIGDFSMSYVGRTQKMLESNEHLIAPGLYPKGTEFLHSVRYIDVDENGNIAIAPRMKELRYGKKTQWASYRQLANATLSEIKEKDAFPDRLRTILGNSESGLSNNVGWIYQGFIEDAHGELRPQNYEENLFCMGCHSGIGATVDTTFVFARKFDANATMRGWYHWSQNDNGFKNIAEPKRADGKGEFTLYLEQNHAGDEFRANDEVMQKFFDSNGSLKQEEVAQMQSDISQLIVPSASRTLELNKAYKVIVEEQSYIYGRDAHVAPLQNVHEEVEPGTPTKVVPIR